GFTVLFWDERMTTLTAERVLIEGGVRREKRKALIDQTAAVVILGAYLGANHNK
ncbi:MAG: Holliday junction resolvase RuvX, partial [Firmicutes bacterium]|nr:Holliday junction resolvase RuvX [Bacillota bacterium]